MKVEKTCITCSKEFWVAGVRANTAKTCSQKCRGVQIAKSYEEKRAELQCKRCGKSFKVPQCHATRRLYCSSKCAAPSRTTLNRVKGPEHYAWNGGVASHNQGYLYVSAPGHPFGARSGNYVFEHRVVMEEWMRAVAPEHPFLEVVDGVLYLKKEIQVHHINLVRTDNRIKNLLACTAAAHHDIHAGVAPMQGEVWPEIAGLRPLSPRFVECVCGTCGNGFIKRATVVKNGGGKFCCRACYNERPREPYPITS